MANNKAHTATVGVFETRAAAERAVAGLRAAGYRDDQIGLVAKNEDGKTVHTDGAGETNAGEGLAIGAAAGAATGGLVGLGILAGVIPVIGPVLAIGTLGTILLNAAGGAAIAGLAGALIGWGIPEEDAQYYESEVQAGRYLVTVTGEKSADARTVFTQHGGYDRSTAATARTATATSSTGTAGSRTSTGAGQTVQVKEEQLKAEKQVNTGEVKVRKEVHTEQRQITVPVEHEEVVIERRPASGKAVSSDMKTEEIRIPTKEEQVRVSKEAVVKEEVTVGKRKVTENQTVTGEVKKEEVVVETEGQAKVRQTNKNDKK